MNLVIHRCTTDETHRSGGTQIIIKHRQRARTDQNVRSEQIAAAVSIVPESVRCRVVYRTVSITPVRVLRRIEEGRLTDRSTVRIVLI